MKEKIEQLEKKIEELEKRIQYFAEKDLPKGVGIAWDKEVESQEIMKSTMEEPDVPVLD